MNGRVRFLTGALFCFSSCGPVDNHVTHAVSPDQHQGCENSPHLTSDQALKLSKGHFGYALPDAQIVGERRRCYQATGCNDYRSNEWDFYLGNRKLPKRLPGTWNWIYLKNNRPRLWITSANNFANRLCGWIEGKSMTCGLHKKDHPDKRFRIINDNEIMDIKFTGGIYVLAKDKQGVPTNICIDFVSKVRSKNRFDSQGNTFWYEYRVSLTSQR